VGASPSSGASAWAAGTATPASAQKEKRSSVLEPGGLHPEADRELMIVPDGVFLIGGGIAYGFPERPVF
jgi:hypothetical protein